LRCFAIRLGWLGAFAILAMNGAGATPLSIVQVSFPAVNCVFNPSCSIVVNDSTGTIAMPFLSAPGTAWLQSRTFDGQPGTSAAGLTGYMYRISLTQASGFGDCLLGFVINFGPISKLPYQSDSPSADVFVGSLGGGLGTIGLASADQDNGVITFTLASPLCVPASPSFAATTYFIGLASGRHPGNGTSTVFAYGSPGFYPVHARVPVIDTIILPPSP
jgi:hypothetical protein